jgi:cytochrome c553
MTIKSLFPILMVVLSVCMTLSCGTDPVVVTPPVAKTTYDKNVKAILVAKCAPCHLAGGVQPSKFDTYATAKAKVDVLLGRVAKSETDPLFMPQNGKKLADSTIAVLTKWKTDGLLEK